MPGSAPASAHRVFYLTHPQVRVAPEVPVPHWGLADKGRARADLAARAAWMQHVGVIVTSGETKALETAAIIAAICDVPIVVRAAMGENDRSATGYLPPDAFEAMVDAFFAEPHASVRGWESAADAQARIVADVDAVLDAIRDTEADARGDVIAFDLASRRLIHGWRCLEDPRVGT